MNKVNNTFEARDMVIGVNASTSGGNTTTSLNSSSLSQDESSTMESKGSIVDQVVIGHESILGGVHAHRSNDDAVRDGQVLGSERLEERGEGSGFAIFSGGGGAS
jgi:hypothetical protein